MSNIIEALLLSGVLSDGNKKKKKESVSDPIKTFERVTKFLEDLKKKEKEKEKKSDGPSMLQQVIYVMVYGPIIGALILWGMSYILVDAVNHLARIHN